MSTYNKPHGHHHQQLLHQNAPHHHQQASVSATGPGSSNSASFPTTIYTPTTYPGKSDVDAIYNIKAPRYADDHL